jgi:hypothetical protein
VLLEAIHRYRTLLGKCELGIGLDWDEIDQLAIIEAAFAPLADDRRMRNGRPDRHATVKRKFRREPVALHAVLRGDRINDRVDVVELGPGGLVCRNAPFVARGEEVEVVIDDGSSSYRFRAVGVWLRDDNEDFKIGLRLVGMSVCLHTVKLGAHDTDVVDRIPAAA